MAELNKLTDFILKEPKAAQRIVADWDNFIANYASTSPELLNITSVNDGQIFYNFRQNHPEVDYNLFTAFEIKNAYQYLPLPHEMDYEHDLGHIGSSHGSTPHAPGGIISIITDWLNRPKTIEETDRYQNIVNELKAKWLKDHNINHFLSQEGLDFLYGNLDADNENSLKELSEKEFAKRHPKEYKKWLKQREKISKNPKNDKALKRVEQDINNHLKSRIDFNKRSEIDFNEEDLKIRIENLEHDRYVALYPKAAASYRNSLPKIDKALIRVQTRQELKKYQKESGKEVKLTYKVHREPQSMTKEQATKRLEDSLKSFEAFSQKHTGLVSASGAPLSSSPISIPKLTIPQEPKPSLILPNVPRITIPSVPPSPAQDEPNIEPASSLTPPPPAQKGGMDLLNSGINNLSNLSNNLKQLGQLAKLARIGSAASGLIASAPVWAPIAAVALVIIIVIVIIIKPKTAEAPGVPGGPETPLPSGVTRQPEVAGLVLEKSASPLELPDDTQNIQFTITATYTGTNEKNIIIKDSLDSKAELIGATGNLDHNADNTLISWKLDPDVNTPQTSADSSEKKYTFTLSVKPKENNINIDNTAYGELSKPADAMCATINNPSTLYTSLLTGNTITNTNFGDTYCTFAGNLAQRTDKLGTLLDKLDPDNKSKWITVAEGESTFSPNAANPTSTSDTAWGLMQMNKEGALVNQNQYDRGDVDWEKQVENAINYNKALGPNQFMCYWQVARIHGFAINCR